MNISEPKLITGNAEERCRITPTTTVFMTKHVYKVLAYEFSEQSMGIQSFLHRCKAANVQRAADPHVC
jgi:hypothetical protein